ncbi:leucine zipper domain-containing protein [Streptomyces sviceus]|uniref:leucine zipper domain-containing protein n=1 Tax=Streptomyces sviceus TaxID=285530 RepID=UPI0037F83602
MAHDAAETGNSGANASQWVSRYRHHGELGLHDKSSTPHRQLTPVAPDMAAGFERVRRTDK